MQVLTMLLSALTLAASTTTTAAHIAARSEHGVVSPRITSPKKDDIWIINYRQLVAWDTSWQDPPERRQRYRLRRAQLRRRPRLWLIICVSVRPYRRHRLRPRRRLLLCLHALCADHLLAEGFNLTDGSQTVIVSNMPLEPLTSSFVSRSCAVLPDKRSTFNT